MAKTDVVATLILDEVAGVERVVAGKQPCWVGEYPPIFITEEQLAQMNNFYSLQQLNQQEQVWHLR